MISDGFDAIWPLDGVGNDVSIGVPGFCCPAIIDVDILVLEVFQTQTDKSFGSC